MKMQDVGHSSKSLKARWTCLWQALVMRFSADDKRQHIGWSFGLVLGFGLVLPSVLLTLAVVFFIGLGKECWDHRYGTGFCLWDIAANLIGMAAAWPMVVMLPCLTCSFVPMPEWLFLRF